MTEDGSTSPWWSVPQALVWIVTRSESQVLRAARLRTIAAVRRLTGLRSLSNPEEPPVTVASAPDELTQAWQARRIALYGREWGKGSSKSIRSGGGICLRDHQSEVCLGDSSLYFSTRPFWSGLSVRADDCRRCWSSPDYRAPRTSRRSKTARHPSDREVLALIEQKQKEFRAGT